MNKMEAKMKIYPVITFILCCILMSSCLTYADNSHYLSFGVSKAEETDIVFFDTTKKEFISSKITIPNTGFSKIHYQRIKNQVILNEKSGGSYYIDFDIKNKRYVKKDKIQSALLYEEGNNISRQLKHKKENKIADRRVFANYEGKNTYLIVEDKNGNTIFKKMYNQSINFYWVDNNKLIVSFPNSWKNEGNKYTGKNSEIIDIEKNTESELSGNVIGVAFDGNKYFLLDYNNGNKILLKSILTDEIMNTFDFQAEEAYLIDNYAIFLSWQKSIWIETWLKIYDILQNKQIYDLNEENAYYQFLGMK